MRYLGNKDKLINDIKKLIDEKIDINDEIVLDAFSGTGSVSKLFGDIGSKVISVDYLYLSNVLTSMKFFSEADNENNINEKIKELNNSDFKKKGYIWENYSPKGGRKYFSEENSQRIDYIIFKIYDWYNTKKINHNEFMFLLGTLLEAVSKVSNVAGVYGAFLKKEDPRYFKEIKLEYFKNNINNKMKKNIVINSKIEEFIESPYNKKIKLSYLDPPYTIQQYSHQYHLLETIATNKKEVVEGITGTRGKKIGSSNFSKNGIAQISLFNLFKNLDSEWIMLSYNNNGITDEGLLDKIIKRVAIKDNIFKKKIIYKKYINKNSNNKDIENYELLYLFKKNNDPVFESPMNYSGSKYKMINLIKSILPSNGEYKFVDLFGGGFNVGLNMPFKNIVYNDLNYKVCEILEYIKRTETNLIIKKIKFYIKKFNLEKNNKEAFIKAREWYNKKNNDPALLLTLIFFGFSHQIRFNSKMEFNNTVGLSDFNYSIQEKLITFSEVLKTKKVTFFTKDFEEFIAEIDEQTLFYVDPPYLVTTASYNDGRRGINNWTENDEKRLLNFLDKINEKKGKFILSNVITHKDKENEILKKWIKKNSYKVIYVDTKLTKDRKEIIVKNY